AERLARLVADHAEARFEIRLRGFGEQLAAYKREESWVSDALTYCDLTTGPTGLPMTFEEPTSQGCSRPGTAARRPGPAGSYRPRRYRTALRLAPTSPRPRRSAALAARPAARPGRRRSAPAAGSSTPVAP